MSVNDGDKRIAYSIVRHLQSQAASGVLDQEGKEGVESKQCTSICTILAYYVFWHGVH